MGTSKIRGKGRRPRNEDVVSQWARTEGFIIQWARHKNVVGPLSSLDQDETSVQTN